MNATQFARSAPLVAGGTVSSAQTAPTEQWTGPAVSTVCGAVVRADVVAALHTFLAQRQAASEAWAGSAESATVHSDDAMAPRAGITGYMTRTDCHPASAEAQRRAARYIRLRFGPEYTDEASWQQGSARRWVASPAANETTTFDE